MSSPVPALRKKLPLWAKSLIGVCVGCVLGVVFGQRPIVFGIHNAELATIGGLVIRLLKTLATPLVFFAIVDAFARTRISAKQGGKLLLFCLMNVTVAMTITLTVMNVAKPGLAWRGHLQEMMGDVTRQTSPDSVVKKAPKEASLDPLKNMDRTVPENLVDPFQQNTVLTVALLGVLVGCALRKVKDEQELTGEDGYKPVEKTVETIYKILVQMLEWTVQLVPYAVMGMVAAVVGKSGLGVFRLLGTFLATALFCLAFHALVYYPLMAWVIGRRSPKEYLGKGADAILTGLSMNSSLGTVPITLKCLKKMNVSESNSRLAACVGTNLNNDGITLYEAMTAIFLVQALGYALPFGKQIVIVLASIMAGAGVAGIPEAGLIVLQLVLAAAGLPEMVIFAALPLILPVDWIIARCRSGVNVMSDMLVAIQLQGRTRDGEEG
ncbi:MAG: dicarboxylate/amino acid:cation symporter [Chthonomonadaceae bacterium]|nr:dicarboxylate/amino acid:cation symporter [Chthonomonadaceae bacterium]